MKTQLTFKDLPANYQGLLALHMLRPIHDKVEYGNALEIIEALIGHDLNTDQEDYLEALSVLVEAYESACLPGLPRRKGLDVLKHLLEENGMSAADLARLLDVDRSLGVRLINRERNLTLEHVKKLSARFKLPLEVFTS